MTQRVRIHTLRYRRAVIALATAMLGVGPACASGGAAAGSDIDEQDAAMVEAGSALYEAHCAQCHGSDLRGSDEGPSHLSEVYEPDHHGDGAFLLAVRYGVRAHHWPFGDMEPVEGLTDGDVAAIVAFVRERQRIEGFEPYPP
jgi:mono/diheme cytochrome c family protein